MGILVTWPLWTGRTLLLDWTPSSHDPIVPRLARGLDGGVIAGLPLQIAETVLTRIIGDLAGWLPILAFFPLAMWSVARASRTGIVGTIGGGLLMCLNPFVFDRIYAGQIAVLLGYALLPVAVASVLRALDEGGGPALARASLWWVVLTSITIHYLWILGFLALVAVLVSSPRIVRLRRLVVVSSATALATAYVALAASGQAGKVTVGTSDLRLYRTQADPHLGLAGNVSGLYGFWRRGPNLTKDAFGFWPALLVAILAVVVLGGVVAVRNPVTRTAALALVFGGALCLVMALGDQGLTGPAYAWMYDHVPGFMVMREPGKFEAGLAVAYSVLFAWGADHLVSWRPSVDGLIVVGVVTLLPIIYTATIFNGLNRQVQGVSVPQSYSRVRTLLAHEGGQALSLPWHQYLSYPWTGRVVSNPTAGLIGSDTITGDDVELPGLPTTSTLKRSGYLEDLYAHGADLTHFGALVTGLDVHYVVLDKTVDWASYSWLGDQTDLTQVYDDQELRVFCNKAWTSSAHRTDQLVDVGSYEQIRAVAAVSDVSRTAFRLVPGASAPAGARAPVSGASTLERRSPVRLVSPAGPSGWLISPEPYAADWRAEGHRPVQLANGTMAFPVPAGAVVMTFTHWHRTLLGYLLSLVSVLALLVLAFGQDVHRFMSGRASCSGARS